MSGTNADFAGALAAAPASGPASASASAATPNSTRPQKSRPPNLSHARKEPAPRLTAGQKNAQKGNGETGKKHVFKNLVISTGVENNTVKRALRNFHYSVGKFDIAVDENQIKNYL